MSQNSTVTCFISPGRAVPGATARAAAGFGMKGSGATASCRPGRSNGAPHWPQNRCSGGLPAPQDGHGMTNGAPHCPQNFIPAELSPAELSPAELSPAELSPAELSPAELSALHRGHLMPSLLGAPETGCRDLPAWSSPARAVNIGRGRSGLRR